MPRGLGSIINIHCCGVREAWRTGRWQPVAPPVKEIDAAASVCASILLRRMPAVA
jgi:hypothetical protein